MVKLGKELGRRQVFRGLMVFRVRWGQLWSSSSSLSFEQRLSLQLGFKVLPPGPGERGQSAVNHVSGVEREMAMNP